ncbi:tail fiber assembly protein [Citrobacter freundii]|uniref:tail fiber assembly protein n=1 Tax=Citrobacter freundii complex TaxID=1344959 RepID=UPI0000340221|nr:MULTISPECIES: tail fiber assembly protein [Citrobacter freundii complex]DAW18587.1 MAG TPA: tail fiber assembly protein [Caudoviricetes sp.]EKQ7213518.1 tail fiber assembly protein [Citrobacter freundii]MBJ8798686.1 tail fiber assembly protein [Citrobacter freundii]MDO3418007.1 tail fiber assembly protein [Citrobacter freundii]MDT7303470.1 tail fiber assembly protein [Citrobacter freundii]
MKLINLQRYIPDEFFLGDDIQYFIDTTGKDWYKSLPKFTKKYSLAIENDTGVIRSISKDASRLYPGGLTVVDVDSIPAGCNIFGGWVFDGEKVIPRQYTDEELKRQAEEKKQTLLTEASSVISPLERAVRLGMATDEENRRIEAWERYSVMVNRVDTSNPEWPTPPGS